MNKTSLIEAVRLDDPTDALLEVAKDPFFDPLRVPMENPYHKGCTILDHCVEVASLIPANAGSLLRVAGFFHDVGKASTKVMNGGHARYRGHDEVGSTMSKAVLASLGFSPVFYEDVALLVALHMRPLQHYKQPMGKKGLRRLIRKANGFVVCVDDLMTLNKADILAHTDEVIRRDLPKHVALRRKLVDIRKEELDNAAHNSSRGRAGVEG